MEEIFATKNSDEYEDYFNVGKDSLKRNIVMNDKSFIYNLNNIDNIVKLNQRFISNIIKIRCNSKTLNQYDKEYIEFIKLYCNIIRDFTRKIQEIIDRHYLKPSFMLDLDIYYTDISNKILNLITNEKKNLQLLGLKLNIMFKNKKRYADELYSMYYHYINSINQINSNLKFKEYTYKLK